MAFYNRLAFHAVFHYLVLHAFLRDNAHVVRASNTGQQGSGESEPPFLVLFDTVNASSIEVQKLFEQASNVSAVAYLLLGAHEPLSSAVGSSNALAPHLTPLILRLYILHPERANSSVAKALYKVSWSLHGSSPTLQACFRDMYNFLGKVFTWVRDNIPLRLQEVPGQPKASAMWPDIPPLELTAAVASALSSSGPLNDTALLISSSCGLTATAFAALVPNISSVLMDLHKDLPILQNITKNMYDANWGTQQSYQDNATNVLQPQARRRLLQQIKYVDAMPPGSFRPAAPATLPNVLVPLVFHILLYQDNLPHDSIGPAQYDQAPSYINRMVRQVNLMAKPTNFQFVVKEVRNDYGKYGYLLLGDRSTWLKAPYCDSTTCSTNLYKLAESYVSDWPRSINIFVASDSASGGSVLGYAFVPASDVYPNLGFVFLSWDSVTTNGGLNSPFYYNYGAVALIHEVFHHLGLQHTFGSSTNATCLDDDYVIDTPATFGPVSSTSFIVTAYNYCLDIIWGQYGGNWDRMFEAASNRLGIPEADMNSWADSCPGNPGYDELGNYMTYSIAACYPALGHLTPGQVQRAHYVTAEMNPILYAWGQYYAATVRPPPPQASPPLPDDPIFEICKYSNTLCKCKSKWTFNGTQYSYCSVTAPNSRLMCEVADVASCPVCTTVGLLPCILNCSLAATPQICNLTSPLPPGYKAPPPPSPPPPRPPSPPPYPPPPPPQAVPEECKFSSSGCPCRSTWTYYSSSSVSYASYCSNPDGSNRLWCQVSSTCPSFADSPFQYCPKGITKRSCNTSPVVFSTTRIPPSPPLAPSSRSPAGQQPSNPSTPVPLTALPPWKAPLKPPTPPSHNPASTQSPPPRRPPPTSSKQPPPLRPPPPSQPLKRKAKPPPPGKMKSPPPPLPSFLMNWSPPPPPRAKRTP
ncbi:hypothetical protein VaNZ11_017132 [Volvox africanus]|uniref:Peptidase M43 pregnancy-associated plasma-A domain-containing protein n=1 Tax=Volvox africanus TaxID=51714 RepID=A0ABQ5SP63_9CHLO|nr:hypothetical protein VaNZ11_017132 [Volvox africanus]